RLCRCGVGRNQPVAPLQLAVVFNAQWRDIKQAKRHVVDDGGITAFELQLDFAERLHNITLGDADLAFVDGRLDPSGRLRIERDYGPAYYRLEHRPQLVATGL